MTRQDYLGHSEEPQEEIHARPALHPDYRPFDFFYKGIDKRPTPDMSAAGRVKPNSSDLTDEEIAWINHRE